MNANATHTATAAKLLNAARDMHDRREVVSHEVPGYGAAHVTSMPASRTYDVGTAARSHATGKRSAVLPALVAILAHAPQACRCGAACKPGDLAADPYAADVHGDETPVWKCQPCRTEARRDI